MNLKLKKSDMNLLLMAVGILFAVGAYFLVYQNFTARTETLKGESAVLKQEVDYLQELANNKQQYLDETEAMKTEIDNIKAQFPAQYLPEDDILYVVSLEKDYKSQATSVKMNPSAAVEVVMENQPAEAPAEAAEAPAEAEEGTVVDDSASSTTTEAAVSVPEIMLYRTPVNVEMISSYDSVKDIIKRINTDENRKSIDNFTVEFDTETGELKTVMDFSLYALSGTEAVYTTPEVKGIIYGTDNLFNSAERKAAIDAEKQAQDDADTDAEKEEEEKKED